MSEAPTAEHLKAAVAARAAHDDAFRAELLANPRAAVEKALGAPLPAHVTIQAIEEAPDTYVVAVPAKVAAGAGGELTDADLEAVAGGSKAGAKKFFNEVGSSLGYLAAVPVNLPAAMVSESGAAWADKNAAAIGKGCGGFGR
jgi:hypothetical protein